MTSIVLFLPTYLLSRIVTTAITPRLICALFRCWRLHGVLLSEAFSFSIDISYWHLEAFGRCWVSGRVLAYWRFVHIHYRRKFLWRIVMG